jgi:hypothetical protein
MPKWGQEFETLALWFEAGDAVERPLHPLRTRKRRIEAVTNQLLPSRRTFWAERCAWMATWERSGFGPQDVDVAQIYDGFSASVIYGLESYGFCEKAPPSTLSRTDASSSTATCRSTPLAAASAPDASTVSGTSSKGPCRPRAAPARAKSRTSMCRVSAPALRSSPAQPSSSCASPTDHSQQKTLSDGTTNCSRRPSTTSALRRRNSDQVRPRPADLLARRFCQKCPATGPRGRGGESG